MRHVPPFAGEHGAFFWVVHRLTLVDRSKPKRLFPLLLPTLGTAFMFYTS